MSDLQAWQWAVIAAATAVSEIVMAVAVVRVLWSRAPARATSREATAFESGELGATPPGNAEVLDVWSYRVAARFAGRCRILVGPSTVTVAGPRVPRGIYVLWIWVQALVLGLVPASVAWAIVALSWRALLAALGVLATNWVISSLGAGLWPGLGELAWVGTGRYPALEFARSSVTGVGVGSAWSQGGMAVILWPYLKGVNAMAAGRAVSFFAPDEAGRRVRFALHCASDEDARRLAGLLGDRS